MYIYVLPSQTVLRRRDNIQAEFEAKDEALATKNVDQEAVSTCFLHPTHTDRKSDTHSPSPSLFVWPPVQSSKRLCVIK